MSPDEMIVVGMTRHEWERVVMLLGAVQVNYSGTLMSAEKAIVEAKAEVEKYQRIIRLNLAAQRIPERVVAAPERSSPPKRRKHPKKGK